jgi:hypothetical protein
MDDATPEPFTVRPSGNVGQVVLGPDRETLAWTTDPWVAQVISRLLGDNEHLLLMAKSELSRSCPLPGPEGQTQG